MMVNENMDFLVLILGSAVLFSVLFWAVWGMKVYVCWSDLIDRGPEYDSTPSSKIESALTRTGS